MILIFPGGMNLNTALSSMSCFTGVKYCNEEKSLPLLSQILFAKRSFNLIALIRERMEICDS